MYTLLQQKLLLVEIVSS